MILGIDEVGRGPWAGPLVVGAVVLGEAKIDGLTDSKKLSKRKREELNEIIISRAAGVGLGWVHADELDEIGLSKSLELACRRAVEKIKAPYHEIIIDGTVNFLQNTSKGKYVTTLKKADLLIASVSAASIVAKVARDRWMEHHDTVYPGYNFASHVGYGTAAHRAAIEAHGLTLLHRKSFAPIAKLAASSTTSKGIGDSAENVVTTQLENDGFHILDRNWKSKFCEIDIVAMKHQTVYFVEVKHRKTHQQGGGVAAITQKKLKQMKFAATAYLHMKRLAYSGRLMAVSTSGQPPRIDSMLEID